MGVGTRIYASNGNACDVTIPEIIHYLGEDEGTRVVVTYVEGLKDPATFLQVAQDVAAKKPLLAMKAGRTAEGAKAAASHTGGLAKEDMVTDLIFKKAGVLSFTDEGDMINAAAAFATQPMPKGKRIGIVTNTGGPAVIATDILVGAGLQIPPLSDKTASLLKEALYPEASVNNPIDVLATGNADHYRACLDAMMADDQFDAILVHFVTPFFVDTESIAKEIVAVSQQGTKPLVCNLMTDKRQWTETLEILRAGGVPCFSLPSVAAKTLTDLVRYHEIRSRRIGDVEIFSDVDPVRANAILESAQAAGRRHLSAEDVYGILGAYGIPVAEWRIADTPEEAAQAAEVIGYPVVVKADAEEIVHKSDLGGVAVNLADGEAVQSAAGSMLQNLGSQPLKFLVQKHLPPGIELIMGAKAESGLGHLVMFGLGGIFVDILKDVVFNLTPVTRTEAQEMISAIKGAPLLSGARGQSGVDRSMVVEIIQRLSQLLSDLPVIQEMDLNPVLAYEDRAVAIDARISL